MNRPLARNLRPIFLGMTSMVGGGILAVLSLWFIYHAVRVYRCTDLDTPRRMFRFSILHLFFIFSKRNA